VRNFGQSTFARRESLRFREGGVFLNRQDNTVVIRQRGNLNRQTLRFCVCVYDFEQAQTGRIVFRSVLKRTTLERLDNALKQAGNRTLEGHWSSSEGANPGEP
jgi:hypothetical protein